MLRWLQMAACLLTFGLVPWPRRRLDVGVLARRITPTLQISNDDLDRQVDTDKPVRVEPFNYSLALQEAWQKAMDPETQGVTVFSWDGESKASVAVAPPPGLCGGGYLHVTGVNPLQVKTAHTSRCVSGWQPKVKVYLDARDRAVSSEYPPAPLGSPRNAYELLTRAAEELARQDAALVVPVFKTFLSGVEPTPC